MFKPDNWIIISFGEKKCTLITTYDDGQLKLTSSIIGCLNREDGFLFNTESGNFICNKNNWGLDKEIFKRLEDCFKSTVFFVLHKNEDYEKIFE